MSCTPDEVGKFVRRKEWFLPGNNVANKGVASVDACQEWCSKYTGCRSFDYDTQSRRCYLHKVVSSDNGVKMGEKAGLIYGELCSGMKASNIKREEVPFVNILKLFLK